MSEPSRTFNAEHGVSFERHEETGDVTIHIDAGTRTSKKVRLSSNTWVSAVAAMTVHGDEANYDLFKVMHTGTGGAV